MNTIKQILLILVFLSFSAAFSEEKAISESKETPVTETRTKTITKSQTDAIDESQEKATTEPPAEATTNTQTKARSQTEAGAVCLDQDCLSNEGALQQLLETTSDQMCKAMQSKPECKGVDKDHLKGCLSSSALAKIGRGVFECVVGAYTGLGMFFVSMYKGIKGIFSDEDDEDPGVKAYLHAEFESNSQDSGAAMASLETAGSMVGLIYNAMADVYSCLNGVGLSKKICQFVGNAPFSGMAGLFAGSVAAGGIATLASLGPMGLGFGVGLAGAGITYKLTENKLLTGGVALGGGVLTGLFSVKAGEAIMKGSRFLFKPAAYAGGVLGATVGAAVTHDLAVQKRIKERMKIKIEEFKKQEEDQTTAETIN